MKSFCLKIVTKLKGFTLAELLTATLVISIIMVALAPVITRRAHDNVAITVNQKQGLEIFTNPGIYSFDVPVGINTLFLQGAGGGGGGSGATYIDKEALFTNADSTTDWKVPKGVSLITFTITGSGGGGGASNGKEATGLVQYANADIPVNGCMEDEILVMRGANDGSDFCMINYNLGKTDTRIKYGRWGGYHDPEETCTSLNCCWAHTSEEVVRDSCQRNPAAETCGYLYVQTHSTGRVGDPMTSHIYRFPYNAEFQRIMYMENSNNGFLKTLNFCDGRNRENNTTTGCTANGTGSRFSCKGAYNNNCDTWCMWSQENMWCLHGDQGAWPGGFENITAGSTRCIRALKHFDRYNGAGGSSGAILKKQISVLPGDILRMTVGKGGTGGKYNVSVNNGNNTKAGNGNRGSETKILHIRNNSTIATYSVLGGLGGNGATNSAHGAIMSNPTPSGTCNNNGSNGCSNNAVTGAAGNANAGGNGGIPAGATLGIDTRGASSGGTYYESPLCNAGKNPLSLEAPYSTAGCTGDNIRLATQRNTNAEEWCAKGQIAGRSGVNCVTNSTGSLDSNRFGYGGGGGMTPTWAKSSSNFYQGGDGAQGKIHISYRVALPGAGGGSGTRVGGVTIVGGETKDYELKYKVTEGTRIVFEIGYGGSGGVSGQDGTNGTPTTIQNTDIIFLAGQGAKAVTQAQKNNLSNCIGTQTNATAIQNCINNSSYKPTAGQAGVIGVDDVAVSSSYGLLLNVSANNFYSPSVVNFKGNAGKTANFNTTVTTIPIGYGFDGGVGGAPFGSREITKAVTCGGGMTYQYGDSADATKYTCTSGGINANSGRVHDPVNNEFGGSGGGGGGVVQGSNPGEGGNGASGYLRIRWNEAEQD